MSNQIYSTKDIIAALRASKGNKRKAARSIGMSLPNLYVRIENEVEIQEALAEIKQLKLEQTRELSVFMVKKSIRTMFKRIERDEASDSGIISFIKMFDDEIKDELCLKSDTIENTDVNETGIDFTYEVIESKDNANEN